MRRFVKRTGFAVGFWVLSLASHQPLDCLWFDVIAWHGSFYYVAYRPVPVVPPPPGYLVPAELRIKLPYARAYLRGSRFTLTGVRCLRRCLRWRVIHGSLFFMLFLSAVPVLCFPCTYYRMDAGLLTVVDAVAALNIPLF